jgi:hypothetical protein
MRSPAAICSVMLAASLAAAPVDVSARELDSIRTFDDWVIGCDNGGTCNAVSLFPAETVLEGWYCRSPFPNTRPKVAHVQGAGRSLA